MEEDGMEALSGEVMEAVMEAVMEEGMGEGIAVGEGGGMVEGAVVDASLEVRGWSEWARERGGSLVIWPPG